MTKQDYELVAKTIKKVRRECALYDSFFVLNAVRDAFAKAFKKDNPRFHAKLFKEACDE